MQFRNMVYKMFLFTAFFKSNSQCLKDMCMPKSQNSKTTEWQDRIIEGNDHLIYNIHAIMSAYLFFVLFSGFSAVWHNARSPVGKSWKYRQYIPLLTILYQTDLAFYIIFQRCLYTSEQLLRSTESKFLGAQKSKLLHMDIFDNKKQIHKGA